MKRRGSRAFKRCPNPTGRANLAITYEWEAPISDCIVQFDLLSFDHHPAGPAHTAPESCNVHSGLPAGATRCAGGPSPDPVAVYAVSSQSARPGAGGAPCADPGDEAQHRGGARDDG